jgi:hypothetical protein
LQGGSSKKCCGGKESWKRSAYLQPLVDKAARNAIEGNGYEFGEIRQERDDVRKPWAAASRGFRTVGGVLGRHGTVRKALSLEEA